MVTSGILISESLNDNQVGEGMSASCLRRARGEHDDYDYIRECNFNITIMSGIFTDTPLLKKKSGE